MQQDGRQDGKLREITARRVGQRELGMINQQVSDLKHGLNFQILQAIDHSDIRQSSIVIAIQRVLCLSHSKLDERL